jgi:adsorption protein A
MREDLSRRWTLSIDGMSSTSPAASVQSPVPGQAFKSYSQIELDYRLGEPAIKDGKTISVYGRVFGGSGPQSSALPAYAPMFGVGLRWKPFSEYVFYLAVEKQVPLDHGTSAPANTMLRASASFLNSGVYSDDWHPAGAGWFSQNLYLDSAYYLSTQAYALTADYRFGYHHKLKEGQTIEPYSRFLATKISGEDSPDIRVGLGVRWNIWANQSRYSAYANKYYVGLELQGAIKTYQNDRVAALLTMGVRW